MDGRYLEHSWKSTLRQLGRHVRKLLGNCGQMRLLRRRRPGYVRFHSEEELRIRRVARDEIYVDREQDGVEVVRTWDSEKRYRVAEANGDLVYSAVEESSVCGRCCLGKCRAWDFHLVDRNGREVARMSRGLRCASCCFPGCLQRLEVRADGHLLGSVTQNWNAWRPSFSVRDANDVPVLLIKGPICLGCNGEADFLIKSIDRQHDVGVITKKWSGHAREFFGDGNSFGLGFPVDLDAKIKAVLIGACLLIDFIYFEEQSNINRLKKTN